MLPSVGLPELLIILVVALIIFGPRKLPELGRSLGKSIGEFRKASNELKSTLEEEIRMEEHKEQRAKLEVEQASAVAGAATIPETVVAPTAEAETVFTPTAEAETVFTPTADADETPAAAASEEPTVSRTPTGTSA